MTAINYSIETVLETAAVLATVNPVLLDGQLGKEVDTGKFKVGNGTLAWSNLTYHDTNGNLSVFMGPSVDPENLVFVSQLDGGVSLTKAVLDFSPEVDQALAGALTLSDRANYIATNRHKASAMLLGVFLKRVINAMGSNFADIVSNPGYNGTTIQASLASLQTAINNLQTSSSGMVVDTATNTTNTWSSQKIASEISTAVQALKNQLVGNAGEALDTIYELAEALQNNTSFVTTITDELGKTIKFTLQNLTTEQKDQARANIGAAGAADVVLVSAQTLSAAQKTQARANIGAIDDSGLVKFVAQTLQDAEKTQARANIGAANANTVQAKNAGIVTGNNATVTSEADRIANGIQILSHTRYGGVVDNGRGFLMGCATTDSGNGLLKMFKAIGNGTYETQAAFTIGGDDNFARIYDKKVATEDNVLNLSNKTYIRPREQRTSLADGVNSIDLRTCGSYVTMRPNGNITLLADPLNNIIDEGRSVALFLYPTAVVTFAAHDAVRWPGGVIPTFAANKATVVHFTLVHFPGMIAFWMAVQGPSWL